MAGLTRSSGARFGGQIPAEPFVDWLAEQASRLDVADSTGDAPSVHAALAERLGFSERAVGRYACSLDGCGHATESFRRNKVEDMLERAGVSFRELYPELTAAEELPVEPDAYCPTCRVTSTPIGGACPWCELAAAAFTESRRRDLEERIARLPSPAGTAVPSTSCACERPIVTLDGDCAKCARACQDPSARSISAARLGSISSRSDAVSWSTSRIVSSS